MEKFTVHLYRLVWLLLLIILINNVVRGQSRFDSIAKPDFRYWFQVKPINLNGSTEIFTKVLDSLNNPIALEEPQIQLNEFWDFRFEPSVVWQDPILHAGGISSSPPTALWIARKDEAGNTYTTKVIAQLMFQYKDLALFETFEGSNVPFTRPGRLIVSTNPDKQFLLFVKWISINHKRHEIQHYFGDPQPFDWSGFIWHEQQLNSFLQKHRRR